MSAKELTPIDVPIYAATVRATEPHVCQFTVLSLAPLTPGPVAGAEGLVIDARPDPVMTVRSWAQPVVIPGANRVYLAAERTVASAEDLVKAAVGGDPKHRVTFH